MAYLQQMKQTQIPYFIGDNIEFYNSKNFKRIGTIQSLPNPNYFPKYGVLSENLTEYIDHSQIIGKTQIQNHLLPNTLDLFNHLNLPNTVLDQPLSFADLFEKPVSDTKKWFDDHLTLDKNNDGCGHCFYHATCYSLYLLLFLYVLCG